MREICRAHLLLDASLLLVDVGCLLLELAELGSSFSRIIPCVDLLLLMVRLVTTPLALPLLFENAIHVAKLDCSRPLLSTQ